MREIDFLPQWYKLNKRRQVSLRSRCIVVVGVFVIIIVWNFVLGQSVSRAEAEVKLLTTRHLKSTFVSQEYDEVTKAIEQLEIRAGILDEIDSRIKIDNVMAEISFLVDDNIALSKVSMNSEKILRKNNDNTKASIAGKKEKSRKTDAYLGDIRFKVVIAGIAADASDVARLTCKLEDSPYFCQVIPSFSRNKTIRAKQAAKDKIQQISEFEMSCYLANFREQTVIINKEKDTNQF